jgi:hypothetical protein
VGYSESFMRASTIANHLMAAEPHKFENGTYMRSIRGTRIISVYDTTRVRHFSGDAVWLNKDKFIHTFFPYDKYDIVAGEPYQVA